MESLGFAFGREVGLGKAGAQADIATAKAKEAISKSYELSGRIDCLSLMCMAMWELLQQETSLSEEDLFSKVKDIDLRDGTLDGKLQKKAAQCTQCGRVLSRKHGRCLYCGSMKLQTTILDQI